MRAGIYLRVSTEDQARNGYSLAEQREACTQRARELGAEEILEFVDEGVSGSTLDRPGLEALRRSVRSGSIQVVVMRDPDRLARKLAHQLLLTEEFERHGIDLQFLDFDWKDTPEGRLFYAVKGAIAEYEKEKIRERMTRGKIQKAKQGGIPVSFTTYGYKYDPESGKVSVVEEEAAVVREIFRLFVSEDRGVNGIAKLLNDRGVPTPRRRPRWHRQVVRQILTHSTYAGVWYYGKVDWHTRQPRSRDEWIGIPVPAIVDISTWQEAQRRLSQSRRLWAKKAKQQYLLSGLISCLDCGNTVSGVLQRWWGKPTRRYTCRRYVQGARNPGCLPDKAICADTLEALVWERVCGWLREPDVLLEELARRADRSAEVEKELAAVDKLILEVERGRQNLLTALASGLCELDEFVSKKLADLKSRREALEKRKSEILSMCVSAKEASVRISRLRQLSREMLDRLDSLTFEEKKSLVRALVRQITISGRGKDLKVTIYANIPEDISLAHHEVASQSETR